MNPLTADLRELRSRARKAREDYIERSSDLLAEYRRAERSLTRKIVEEIRETGMLEVLVRTTPGPQINSYHSALYPCGWVRTRRNFDEWTEADASGNDLVRCTACHWEQHEAEVAADWT